MLGLRARLAACVPGTACRNWEDGVWLDGGGRGATRVGAAGVRRNKRCRGTRADAITMAHNSQHAQKQIAGRLVRLCEVVGVRTI